jgi:hypothetical protein
MDLDTFKHILTQIIIIGVLVCPFLNFCKGAAVRHIGGNLINATIMNSVKFTLSGNVGTLVDSSSLSFHFTLESLSKVVIILKRLSIPGSNSTFIFNLLRI